MGLGSESGCALDAISTNIRTAKATINKQKRRLQISRRLQSAGGYSRLYPPARLKPPYLTSTLAAIETLRANHILQLHFLDDPDQYKNTTAPTKATPAYR